MKKTFPVLALLILAGCSDSNVQEPSREQDKTQTSRFSPTYLEPVFTDAERLEKIRATLPAVETIFMRHAEENHYPGFVYGVVVDSSLIFSGSVGSADISGQKPISTESQFHIASMTKSFVAMAILKLRDEGILRLRDEVSQYIPELAGLKYLTRDAPAVTIKNLLTMTAGFPEDNPWGDRQLDLAEDEFLQFIEKGISFSGIPSDEFEYSNLGYALLGVVVSRVSGTTYQSYITDQILSPLGMNNTYWDYADVPDGELVQGYRWEDEKFKEEPMLHTGAFGAIGGLITSMSDFSKYVVFHLSAWPARNEIEHGPVKRSSLREMHAPNTVVMRAKAKDRNDDPCPVLLGYAYGLGMRKDCTSVVQMGHSGGLPGFGSNYIFYPDYGIGIMSFSSLTYSSASSVNREVSNVIFDQGNPGSRKMRVSDILNERSGQVVQLLQAWEIDLGNKILAENFYLDHSRESRMIEAEEVLAQAGEIMTVDPIIPFNQLRGRIIMHGEKGDVRVFFSLTPEKIARVQALRLSFVEKE